MSEIGWERIENYCSPDSQVIIGNNRSVTRSADSPKINEMRRAIQHDLQENETNDITYETSDDGIKHTVDESYLEEEKMEQYISIGMESTPYDDIDIDPKNEVNIVIGGETEGLSGGAFRFAQKHFGHCANIPLGNDIESLNSAVASGILLYHVQNQFLKNNVDYVNLLSQKDS